MRQLTYQNQILQFIVFQLVLLPLNLSHTSFLPDVYLRWDYAAAPLTNFFFFWTTFTYVPTFFTSLFLITYLFIGEKKEPLLFIFLLCYYLYFYEIIEASVVNLSYYTVSFTSFQYNLLLINPLNKYHPFFLYLSIVIAVVYVANLLVYPQHPNTTYFRYLNKILSSSLKYGFLLMSASLFLGSWWALQEGTWGGWWNWDPSEVFGLLYLIFYITFLHEKRFKNLFYKVKLRSSFNLLCIKLIYFFIQINFKIVSHNFGLQFVFFFNNLFFFTQLLGYVSIVLIFSMKKFCVQNQQTEHLTRLRDPLFLNKNNFFFSKVLILISILILLFLHSFQPMFFLFLKEYFSITFFNNVLPYNYINVIFFILLSYPLLRILKHKNYIFTPLQLLFVSKYTLLGLVPFNKKKSTFSSVHISLLLFFLLNTSSLNDISFLPLDLGLADFIDFFNLNSVWIDSNYNIDGLIISRNHYMGLNFSKSWIASSNTFLTTNTTTSNNFFFFFSNTYFFNTFFLTTLEAKFLFLIDFLHLSSLLLVLFVAIWFLIK